MTEKDLEKIFAEVHAEIYSPEYRKKIEERIKQDRAFDDTDFGGLALVLAVNSELDKTFLFRVLTKALCDNS